MPRMYVKPSLAIAAVDSDTPECVDIAIVDDRDGEQQAIIAQVGPSGIRLMSGISREVADRAGIVVDETGKIRMSTEE